MTYLGNMSLLLIVSCLTPYGERNGVCKPDKSQKSQ